jgi:uncharacterized membrane protein HdeD (DUF308 family)
MEFDSILTAARVVVHLGITLVLSSYQPQGARHRYGVSFLAALLAASSLGQGVGLLVGAVDPKAMGGQWLNLGLFGAIFCLILACRGNVAKILPRCSHGAR